MIFWEQNTDMTSFFDDFLDEGLLREEVGRKLKNVLAATSNGFRVLAGGFTLAVKARRQNSSFPQYLLDAFWLIWVFWMVSREDH
jgi:hypothetical protein